MRSEFEDDPEVDVLARHILWWSRPYRQVACADPACGFPVSESRSEEETARIDPGSPPVGHAAQGRTDLMTASEELRPGDAVTVMFTNGVVTAVDPATGRVQVRSPRFYGGGWFEADQVTVREADA